MKRSRYYKSKAAALMLACGLATTLLAIAPGSLPQARGQTAGPVRATPPPSSGSPTVGSLAPTQLCPGGQVIPANLACPAPPLGSSVVLPGQAVPAVPLAPPFLISAAVGPASSGVPAITSGPATPPVAPAGPSEQNTPATTTATAPLQGETVTGAVTVAPPASLLPATVFAASSSATIDPSQMTEVDALVDVADPASGQTSTVQAASVNIPAGMACGGSGPASVLLTVSNTGQPLGATLDGTCADGSELSLGGQVTVCATVTQDVANDGTPTLADATETSLTGASFDGVRACGETSTPGSFTVAVS